MLSFDIFCKLATQWNRSDSTGHFFGLNYASVSAYLSAMLPAEKVKDIFEDIQIMEFAALPFLNKKEED